MTAFWRRVFVGTLLFAASLFLPGFLCLCDITFFFATNLHLPGPSTSVTCLCLAGNKISFLAGFLVVELAAIKGY